MGEPRCPFPASAGTGRCHASPDLVVLPLPREHSNQPAEFVALLTVADASTRCRELCVDYIDSQLALIERNIGAALLRRRLDERPVTQELRGFANAYRQARAALAGSSATALSERAARAAPTVVEAFLNGV